MGKDDAQRKASAPKRLQAPSRLVEKKIRITPLTDARIALYSSSRDNKPEADCYRDILYAGLEALGVPREYPEVAGTIRPAPKSAAA